MCALKLDISAFDRRAEKFFLDWEGNNDSYLYDLDAFIVAAGKIDGVYGKTLSLHADADKAGIDKMVDAIRKSGKGKSVGYLAKDKFSSDLTEAFQAALKTAGFDLRDASGSISNLLAIKETSEVGFIKKACDTSCNLFNKHLKEQIMDIIDYDRKVKHEKLSNGCHAALQKIGGVDADSLELCYDPIIQSGGNYNLKFSTESDTNTLHFGTIVCSVGVRYHSYCSNVIRTLLVNPTEQQSRNYAYLHDLLDWSIEQIKPGQQASRGPLVLPGCAKLEKNSKFDLSHGD